MKKSIFGALVTSAVIGFLALTGCDASLDSVSGTGLEGFDRGSIDSRSIVVGYYFDNAVWQTDDGDDMANQWDFTGGGGESFVFRHYMGGKWNYIGTYKYTLSADILTLTPIDGDPQGPFRIYDDTAADFYVDPEPLGMGGIHFVKQPKP